jgi:Bacterial PH domain
MHKEGKMFDISPASNGPVIFFIILSLFLVLLIGLFGYIVFSAHAAKFEVGESGLRIYNTIYGKFIPKENLDLNGILVVDLKTQTSLQPQLRTNGVGLPGYEAGWFNLKDKERALLFVTDRENVVYIPTNLGYSILLSTKDTNQMLDSLQSLR